MYAVKYLCTMASAQGPRQILASIRLTSARLAPETADVSLTSIQSAEKQRFDERSCKSPKKGLVLPFLRVGAEFKSLCKGSCVCRDL